MTTEGPCVMIGRIHKETYNAKKMVNSGSVHVAFAWFACNG
jgi:hypothetical protein